MTKADIRAKFLQRRAEISNDDRSLFDQLIFERAHKTSAFQLANVVHVYRSVRHEVETTPFMEYAWGTGKQVYVPFVPPGTGVLHHCRVTWQTQWREGAFGISEPVPQSADDVITNPSFFGVDTAVVVPVVAFNNDCHRLGYGKGYYDKFLSQCTAFRIGLAYECQREPLLLPESHDVFLHRVATEERWYTRLESVE